MNNLPENLRSKQPPGPVSPEPEQPEVVEDASSRALSEALKSSFFFVKVIMVVLVLVFLGSGIFTVPPQEQAIILRFGKPVGEPGQQLLGPGLHWSFPYPIDERVRIPLGQVQTVTSRAGWFAVTPEQERTGQLPWVMPALNPATEGYTLTADGNIIHVRATVSYRIHDPLQYALHYVNASNVVQNLVDNALFNVSAQFTADQIVRDDQTAFRERLEARLREMAGRRQLGITIEQANVRSIPPRQVEEDFHAVIRAELDRRRTIDEALGYQREVLNRALGEANQIVNSGMADRARRLYTLQAEADYFSQILPAYRRHPELYRDRLQVETLARVLTNARENWLMPAGHYQLWLQLGKEPEVPARPEEPEYR